MQFVETHTAILKLQVKSSLAFISYASLPISFQGAQSG
jgi:hypothetical protein